MTRAPEAAARAQQATQPKIQPSARVEDVAERGRLPHRLDIRAREKARVDPGAPGSGREGPGSARLRERGHCSRKCAPAITSWSNWGPKSAVPRSSKIRCGDLLCNSAGILGRGDRI